MSIDDEEESIAINGPNHYWQQQKHPMSSSSMVGPIDDSDGEDEQEQWGRPPKKAQLRLISALLRDSQSFEQAEDAGTIRYVLPTAWFEAWEDYCTFPQSRSDPGPIDLLDLMDPQQQHSTMLVSGQVWNLLASWYGMRESPQATGAIAFVDATTESAETVRIAYKLSLQDPQPSYTTISADGKVSDLYGKLVRLALEHQAAAIRTSQKKDTTSSFEGWRILNSEDPLKVRWLDDLIAQESLVQAGLAREDLIYCLDSEAYKKAE